MKKLLFSLLLLFSFTLTGFFVKADGGGGGGGGGGCYSGCGGGDKIITLSPGWNVFSTPKILSGITFSNGGAGVSFYTLLGSKWQSIIPTPDTLIPLEGFVVNNSTTGDVLLTLNYKTDVNPMQTLFQKTLNLGRNFLGITTITNPFASISNATMFVDFTKSVSSNLSNKVNNAYSFTVNSPELGESYGVFISSLPSVYGGNQSEDQPIDICTTAENILACTLGTSACPAECSVSNEIEAAYDYAYGMGITTQSSVYSADPYGLVYRYEIAKMIVNYAKEVFNFTSDTSKVCNFVDIANQSAEIQSYIIESCQLGLMGVDSSNFNPYGEVTRAEFATMLSRIMWGNIYDGGTPYYSNHLNALFNSGIILNTGDVNKQEIKSDVWIMMKKADEISSDIPDICSTAQNILACTLGTSACPAECMDPDTGNTGATSELSIAKVNTEAGALIRNKDNVFLGAFSITNAGATPMSLQNLRFDISGSSGVLDNVKLKLGSTTASPIDLTQSGNVWSERDLGKSIGSKLTVYIYGDTANIDMDGKSIRIALNTPIIYDQNDLEFINITPSTLTWSTLYGQSSNGLLTNVALADKTVSEGTEGIDVMQFKIKASGAYGIKIKKITFDAISSGVVDSDTVVNATLYQGTTQIYATIKSGSIVVDEDFTIPAETTATLTLKIDLASNPESTGFRYDLSGAKIYAEELSSGADNIIFSTLIVGRTISVVSNGEIKSTYESTAINNKYNKTILAGDSAVVAEYGLYSMYETINIGSGIVVFSGSSNIQDSVLDVQLYYGDVMVASNPIWSNGGKIASFTDIDFDTATAKKALTVKVVSRNIDSDGGNILNNVIVSNIILGDLRGNDSLEDISDFIISEYSKSFSIVPVTIVPAISLIGGNRGDFTVTSINGSNTTSGGNQAKARFTTLTFSVDANNGGLVALTLKDDAGNTLKSQLVFGNSDVIFTGIISDLSIGTTSFTVSATLDGAFSTPSYDVSLRGISYTTNVDGYNTIFDSNFGSSKTILTK